MASLILGTTFTSLWLLRSRPDQVHDECMRGDPPRVQFIKFLLKNSRKRIDLLKSLNLEKMGKCKRCQRLVKMTFFTKR